jgi:hypothetical protein
VWLFAASLLHALLRNINALTMKVLKIVCDVSICCRNLENDSSLMIHKAREQTAYSDTCSPSRSKSCSYRWQSDLVWRSAFLFFSGARNAPHRSPAFAFSLVKTGDLKRRSSDKSFLVCVLQAPSSSLSVVQLACSPMLPVIAY